MVSAEMHNRETQRSGTKGPIRELGTIPLSALANRMLSGPPCDPWVVMEAVIGSPSAAVCVSG